MIARNHKSKANRVFVLCLALSDMIFILFCVPFQGLIYTFPHWIFGRILCKDWNEKSERFKARVYLEYDHQI